MVKREAGRDLYRQLPSHLPRMQKGKEAGAEKEQVGMGEPRGRGGGSGCLKRQSQHGSVVVSGEPTTLHKRQFHWSACELPLSHLSPGAVTPVSQFTAASSWLKMEEQAFPRCPCPLWEKIPQVRLQPAGQASPPLCVCSCLGLRRCRWGCGTEQRPRCLHYSRASQQGAESD